MTHNPSVVLLVDDCPNDVDLILRLLKPADRHEIVVARDGEEALNFLNGGNPATGTLGHLPRFILLDLKMPKVDGIEVLRQIKSNPQLNTVPVVMFTSSREKKDVTECYQLGVNAYVVKPVDFGAFRAAVEGIETFWTFLNEMPANKLERHGHAEKSASASVRSPPTQTHK